MLRFGDGTPFPLDESFLEVLVDAVIACTTMLTATADLEERHARARQKQRALLEEEHKLERFEQTVRLAATSGALADLPAAMPSDQATRLTIAAMQHAVMHSREQLKQHALANAAEFDWSESARQVELAVGEFFDRRVLPGTVWSWSWNASPEGPRFEATAQGARFTVRFDLERDALWRAPIRIAALAPGVVMDLPQRRWFGKPGMVSAELDRYVLVSAQSDPDGRSLVIQKHAGAASGWWITLLRDGSASATAFDRHGHVTSVAPVTTSQCAALIHAIDLQLCARLNTRRARAVLLGGVAVSAITDTTTAPRALLDEIGPVVREIRTRSRVPGELSLKRDVAAGVREEIFVSRTQLTACYASLPPQYRHLLDAIGVGRGLTEASGEGNSANVVPLRVAPPPIPQPLNTNIPVVPRRPSARTPTTPVKSLRAIPIQRSDSPSMAWGRPRPATA